MLFQPTLSVSPAQSAAMLLVLASSAAAAANLVLLKKYSLHTDIFALSAFSMSLGALGLLSLSWLTESYVSLAWTKANVLAIVYLALVGSVAAFLSFYYLVKVMEATRLSLISLIFPVVAVILGAIFLGEKITRLTEMGMMTVLAGVAVTLWKGRPASVSLKVPGGIQGAS